MNDEIVVAVVRPDRYFTNPATADRAGPGAEVRVKRGIFDLSAGILVEKGSEQHQAIVKETEAAEKKAEAVAKKGKGA